MKRVIIVFLFSFLAVFLHAQTEIPYNDTSYFTPFDDDFNLIMAASKGHLNNVQNLLQRGADINAVTIDNISALMYATENGDFEMVRFLIENGADPNLRPFNGITAFISAARLNYAGIAEFLINNGANINASDAEGVTGLHYAVAYNYQDLVKMLLYYEADPEKPDKKGNPPIITAAYNNSLESLKLLVENGVNPDSKDMEGYTPLMVSISQNNEKITEYLLGMDVEVNSSNKGNMTPLALAITKGNYELTEKLLEKGADINHRISKNQNILELAKSRNEDEIIDLLQASDAKPNYFPGYNIFGMGPGMDFNGSDFITSIDLSLIDTKYNTSINGGFGFRPSAVRTLTDPVNDTLYQYWERRYYFYAGLEKRFLLFSPEFTTRSGPYISLNGIYSFGNYRGSNSRPDPGLFPSLQAGWYYMNRIITLKFGYQYLDLKTSISPHRVRLSLLFNLNSTRNRSIEKNIEWLNNE
jgi:ankyrin repeat protein